MPPPAGPLQQQQSESHLLALPEPLLLAVLQCLAAGDDQRNLFSAARAHSRLHKATHQYVSSITVGSIKQQVVLESVSLYLSKHGQHIRSVALTGALSGSITLRQLPPCPQLTSLELHSLRLQLLPGGGFQGVLGPAAGLSALKQLRLKGCRLVDDNPKGSLAAALAQLPGLEQLSCDTVYRNDGRLVTFPAAVLQQLQQLTCLDLPNLYLDASAEHALQPLQALSRLLHLRVNVGPSTRQRVTASMLSGASRLTHLQLQGTDAVEPGVLAGKAQLQHLHLECSYMGSLTTAADVALLLSNLQPLQQLTHLSLHQCVRAADIDEPEGAAYSALTASSKLQHLSISRCTMPAGVFEHLFPAGRQLPHLTHLSLAKVGETGGGFAAAPEGSRLVSCCPGLQHLELQWLSCNDYLLAPLTGLRPGLHTLRLTAVSRDGAEECLGVVWQLTGLQELAVVVEDDSWGPGPEGLLLGVTQLRQLTALDWSWSQRDGTQQDVCVSCKAPGDEPVWRQVLRAHLDHSDPAVAQAAAAALAEAE